MQPAFFGLTFLLAWAVWLTAAGVTSGLGPFPGREWLFLPGTFAPGVVALWLTARTEGRAGVDALLGRLFASSVPVRWYVFAAGYMAVVKLTAAVGHRLLIGDWPVFGPTPWYLMLTAVAFSTPFQAGEEIGWRGFALPRLAARLGLARAGIVLGVIWAVWHLPFFYIPNTDSSGQPFLLYVASVTALSVAMTWLYAHAQGNLPPVLLMHAAINNTTGIVPSAAATGSEPFALAASPMAWLTAATLWAGALYFLARMPGVGRAESRAATRPPAIA